VLLNEHDDDDDDVTYGAIQTCFDWLIARKWPKENQTETMFDNISCIQLSNVCTPATNRTGRYTKVQQRLKKTRNKLKKFYRHD